METDQRDLFQKIEAFRLDDPAAAIPFSWRLAREQGWTLDFTHRAIAEYKRFAFLACAAGHPVSPSDEVDQVWHEHLTFTRSYWEDFCDQVLGRPLHHEPTRGGRDEEGKYREWYARTLASYERLFGEKPPADLWPPVDERFADDAPKVKVDPARNWVIPRPAWLPASLRIAALAACALSVAGCVSMVAVGLGPFDLPGPAFLGLFWGLSGAAILGGFLIRRQIQDTEDVPPDTLPMDAYSIALLGSRKLATHAAVAQLVQTGALHINVSTRLLTATTETVPRRDDLERTIYERVAGRTQMPVGEVLSFAIPVLLRMEQTLRANGLLLSEAAAQRAGRRSALLSAAVFLFGLVKINVGLSRDRPVSILVVSCLIPVIAGLLFLLRPPRRTRAAEEYLEELRGSLLALKTRPLDGIPTYASSCLPLAIGLFGYSVLDQTAAADLNRVLNPPNSGGGDSGSSGCSGGSGCGGGGGCGGCSS